MSDDQTGHVAEPTADLSSFTTLMYFRDPNTLGETEIHSSVHEADQGYLFITKMTFYITVTKGCLVACDSGEDALWGVAPPLKARPHPTKTGEFAGTPCA